nr:MAG TPA: nucelotide kinase [Caudoviricetes sp.]
MRKDTIFKLGDRVYAPFHGYGVVTAIHKDACVYPIEVTWDDSGLKNMEDVNTFTADGLLSKYFANTDTILTVVEQASLKGEKEMEECINFKVGDRVSYPYHGLGTVIANYNDGRPYPIDVKWDKSPKGHEVSTFTKDGFLVVSLGDCGDNDKLTVVEKVMPAEEEKKSRVSSKEEAYDIMTHLMNRKQLEGFLWGNIIKYAYRYGRKGDEAETAGKIKWYAQKLKELGECESE